MKVITFLDFQDNLKLISQIIIFVISLNQRSDNMLDIEKINAREN